MPDSNQSTKPAITEVGSSNFVDPPEDSADFITNSAKGAVKESPNNTTGGRSYSGPRTSEPPKDAIEERRTLYNQDPHVGHSVETTLDWLLADGWNVSKRNITGLDIDMDAEKVAQLRRLLINSDFDRQIHDWCEKGAVEGHAFMELVVTDEGMFKPRILPFERMHKYTDEYGNAEEYILEPPEGGGPDSDDATVYSKHEVAEIWFRKGTLEDFGHSLIERVREQADMLRDMEIDYARFVASKAYPPILWKCGTEESQWSEDQISGWLDDVEEIEPDSMIGGPHDVEAEVVGATSTSSSAGAMRLEETFEHHQRRIITGIGIPAMMANMDAKSAAAEAIMPAFKRRIKRYQTVIKNAIEEQIIRPLFIQSVNGQDDVEEYTGLIPEFEFGEHSNAENRLELDKLVKLFNNGFLTRKAFAERAGIDFETEMPDQAQLTEEIIPLLQELSGKGDEIQNPDGGRPTDTGGGAQSSGREASSREDATTDNSGDEDRPKKSPTEDES